MTARRSTTTRRARVQLVRASSFDRMTAALTHVAPVLPRPLALDQLLYAVVRRSLNRYGCQLDHDRFVAESVVAAYQADVPRRSNSTDLYQARQAITWRPSRFSLLHFSVEDQAGPLAVSRCGV